MLEERQMDTFKEMLESLAFPRINKPLQEFLDTVNKLISIHLKLVSESVIYSAFLRLLREVNYNEKMVSIRQTIFLSLPIQVLNSSRNLWYCEESQSNTFDVPLIQCGCLAFEATTRKPEITVQITVVGLYFMIYEVVGLRCCVCFIFAEICGWSNEFGGAG